MPMEPSELRAAIEAILFLNNEPVRVDELAEAFAEDGGIDAVVAQIEEIKRILDANVGGFMLENVGGGWRLATRAEHEPTIKRFFQQKTQNRLSIAALETLAIIAYRQPITAPEVSELRGVNSNAVIRTLLERRMIRVAGRKNVVGSPFLYRSTKDFLLHFGLNDIRDLPRLEEFGDLIGENINEDLVAAIESAPEPSLTPADITEPANEEEAAANEAQALSDLAAADEARAESASSSQGDAVQSDADVQRE
jgi:segregation and condensation protein B